MPATGFILIENGRRHREACFWILRPAGGLLLLLLAMAAADPALGQELPPEKEAATQLMIERCHLCHYLNRTDFKYAPGLKDLYKRPSRVLVNSKPVNDATVTEFIVEGSANMPSFKNTLTGQQIQLIVKFLKEGWAAEVPLFREDR